jgi:hypothetical protein
LAVDPFSATSLNLANSTVKGCFEVLTASTPTLIFFGNTPIRIPMPPRRPGLFARGWRRASGFRDQQLMKFSFGKHFRFNDGGSRPAPAGNGQIRQRKNQESAERDPGPQVGFMLVVEKVNN